MNIRVQCCGIALMILIAIIYGQQKRLKLTTNKVFQGCFWTTLFCMVLDIVSLFAIVYREKISLPVAEFICKTYLVSIVLVALLSVVYVATSVSFHLRDYKKNIQACILFAVVISGLIYALPIRMVDDVEKNLGWTEGPSDYATYLGVLLLIVINLVQMFVYKKYIYERQRRTVLNWMFMWILAACIQMLHSPLLLVSFACALGIAVVFFQFENPELNLDWNTGLFNYVAYTRYGEQLYSGNKKFYVIAVKFQNTTWESSQNSHGITGSQKMLDTFLKIPNASVFKIMENVILLFISKEESAKSAWNNIKMWTEKEGAEVSQRRSSFYFLEDPRCVSNHRELLELLQYVALQQKDVIRERFHIVDTRNVFQMFAERSMKQRIIEALEEDRILVYYQPIYSVREQRFTSAEALVRIIDQEGNLIQPGAFINIAESSGMIIEVGKRVFEKVCRFFKQYNLEEYGINYIEINLSVVQCADEKLADNFIEIMNDFNINPSYINLEITESASMHAKQNLILNMEKMIDCGIHFSLDDFGTGQSNLNYIVDMPVKIVKFDREMIQAYFTSEKARYVMDAAMRMIHGMGLKIVAEGIETEEQYKKMEDINIDYIQGYYFSKPVPEQDFLNFLRQKNELTS